MKKILPFNLFLLIFLSSINGHAQEKPFLKKLIKEVGRMVVRSQILLMDMPQHCYDFEAEISRLMQLKEQGKVVGLIIGRTYQEDLKNQDVNGPLPQIPNRVWVYGDLKPTKLSGIPHPIQLTRDFNSPVDYLSIPSESFDEIIFDGSTLKFFYHFDFVLPELVRILRPGGRIVFEIDTLQGYEPSPKFKEKRFPTYLTFEINGGQKDMKERISLAQEALARSYQKNGPDLGLSKIDYYINENYPITSQYLSPGATNFLELVKESSPRRGKQLRTSAIAEDR